MIGHLERTVSPLGNRKNSLRNISVDTLINGQDDNWIPVTPPPSPARVFMFIYILIRSFLLVHTMMKICNLHEHNLESILNQTKFVTNRPKQIT